MESDQSGKGKGVDTKGQDPLGRLAAAAAEAKKIALTRDVRFDPHEMLRILDELRGRTSRPGAQGSLEELAEAIRGARPVPLTDQVRMNRHEFHQLVEKVQLEAA
jgi:hypothetical protein